MPISSRSDTRLPGYGRAYIGRLTLLSMSTTSPQPSAPHQHRPGAGHRPTAPARASGPSTRPPVLPAAPAGRQAERAPCPVPVALALLNRRWSASPALADGDEHGLLAALAADPRYLIGRFHQALTTLLASDLPPADPVTSLLSQALADAIAWRHHQQRPCPACSDTLCSSCTDDWDQADHYHALAITLGAVGDTPAAATR